MTDINAKDLIVAVKSFARANPLPLDKDEVWQSLSEAEAYIQGSTVYPGQTIKVLVEDKYIVYTIQKDLNGNLFLEPIKRQATNIEDIKGYIDGEINKLVDELQDALPSNDDALSLIIEKGFVKPVGNIGRIFTDKDGAIFIL